MFSVLESMLKILDFGKESMQFQVFPLFSLSIRRVNVAIVLELGNNKFCAFVISSAKLGQFELMKL